MTLPDGTRAFAPDAHLRATELRWGPTGNKRCPGAPTESGYTYAADYSFDEAIEATRPT